MYVVMAMRSWDKSFKYGEGEKDFLDLSNSTKSVGFLEVYETKEDAESEVPPNAAIMEVNFVKDKEEK